MFNCAEVNVVAVASASALTKNVIVTPLIVCAEGKVTPVELYLTVGSVMPLIASESIVTELAPAVTIASLKASAIEPNVNASAVNATVVEPSYATALPEVNTVEEGEPVNTAEIVLAEPTTGSDAAFLAPSEIALTT